MAEVIARVRRELQDRLKEIEAELAGVEALIAERARLEHALATPPFASAEREQRTARIAAPRAPRGANRAAVFAALETMPGATVGELASASRVGRQQTYALLRAGVERGEVTAVALAGGLTGYRSAAEPETAFPARTPEPAAASPEPEAVVSPESDVSPTPEAVASLERDVSPTPEAVASLEPEAVASQEPDVSPTPEAVASPQSDASPQPETSPTPEAVASSEPDVSPTPEAVASPQPETSPAAEAVASPEPS